MLTYFRISRAVANARPLLFALTGCAVLYAAALATRGIAPMFSDLGVRTEGAFARDGQFKGESLAHANGVHFWGSWCGSDDNTGALTLGPMVAPALLRFAVGGYPTHEGNQVFLELGGTGTRVPVKIDFDVGTHWQVIDCAPPADWIGRPVLLQVRDDAKGPGGWVAISEPVRGGAGTGQAELFATLSAWSLNGLLLGLLWFAALRLITARAWLAPHWAVLGAAGVVAMLGYLAFWIYFASATLGKFFSVALLLLGLFDTLRPRKSPDRPGPEARAVPKLLLAIGLFYLALLHLYPSSREFYNLAANRFRDGLPGDNTLPHNVAANLYHGEKLRSADADWLSSDRPPLQAGWCLLAWPITTALRLDERTASGTAAVWFQSLWVFGVYGLLRTLGLPRGRACAWLALMALAGFFVQHTVFTWPKLSAAAFACGAFGLWLFPEGPIPRRSEYCFGALLAALAWLSHGGVAFSFLALVPWLTWRVRRGPWREWAWAALLFVSFTLPWCAYQRYYDPPGNRLLKWHLGGQIPKDSRGTWRTIRESYHALTWKHIAENKALNFRLQWGGNWRWWQNWSTTGAAERRGEEFFLTGRALTWWLLGCGALPVAIMRGRLRRGWRAHAALAGWTCATLMVWCLLMFGGGQAVIHQGSYTVMLGLFALLSAWCELLGAWTLALVAFLQIATFMTTWAAPNAVINGPLNGLAAGLAVAVAIAIIMFVTREDAIAESIRAPSRLEPDAENNGGLLSAHVHG